MADLENPTTLMIFDAEAFSNAIHDAVKGHPVPAELGKPGGIDAVLARFGMGADSPKENRFVIVYNYDENPMCFKATQAEGGLVLKEYLPLKNANAVFSDAVEKSGSKNFKPVPPSGVAIILDSDINHDTDSRLSNNATNTDLKPNGVKKIVPVLNLITLLDETPNPQLQVTDTNIIGAPASTNVVTNVMPQIRL